jgi:dihydroorotase
MSHAVADCFSIKERGYIREGYFADLVVVDLKRRSLISKPGLLYKCGWSPLEGEVFPRPVIQTFVSGNCVYSAPAEDESSSVWEESLRGQRLVFDR